MIKPSLLALGVSLSFVGACGGRYSISADSNQASNEVPIGGSGSSAGGVRNGTSSVGGAYSVVIGVGGASSGGSVGVGGQGLAGAGLGGGGNGPSVGGSVGSAGGSAGSAGRAGNPGTAGIAGIAGDGSAGAGGTNNGELHVTSATAFPAAETSLVGLLIAVDSQDTAVVLGPSAQTASYDPGPALTWIPTSGPTRQKTFAGEPTPTAMAVDASNAVWLAGRLEKAATFGGTTIQPVSTGYYLVKIAADGSNVFTKAIARSETDVVYDSASSIAFDAQGNAYVVGDLIQSSGMHCSVLVDKFSPTGTLLVDRVFPGTGNTGSAMDAAVAPNGDLVIAGQFAKTLAFGATTLTSASGEYKNGFVATLDPADLSAKHAQSFGGASFYDMALAIDVTSTGALRVSGSLAGQSSIGGATVQANAGGSAFIAELTAAGTLNWVDVLAGQGIVFQTSTGIDDRTFAVGRIESGNSTAFLIETGPGATLAFPLLTDVGWTSGATATAADRHGGAWVSVESVGATPFGTVLASGADPTLLTNFLVHLEP
ncbi:MAG: hypothetical protein WDO69_11170 [Pseudomonadota bacterium]